jgi:hypothetical protein
MHSALAYTCSAATASDTPVPSRAVFFRQTTRARRLRPRQFAAPLFSYSLAPIREGYELLFPPARPNHFVFSLTYRSLGGQPLCFYNHPHCPGVWGSPSRAASVLLCALCVSVANPFFSCAYSLFARAKKVNSFAIKQIQPLFRKHPGWGYVNVQTARHTTWTWPTHPIIIAARFARLRSQVHG